MNRRLEEELLQTAFGEASPEESAELERRIMQDPEAARAFKTYQFMKEGLKDLGEVPEHQLSTDRLRHAILEQGLKPKRESIGFGWLTVPALAAAAVFGFFFIKQMNAPSATTPSVVINTTDRQPSGFNSDPINIERNDKPQPNTSTVAVADPDEPEATGIIRHRTRGVVYHQPGDRSKDRDPIGISISDEALGPPKPVVEEALENVDVKMARGDRNDIIVIQPERDATTGASKATEVGSASNVAIGG